MQRFFVVAVMLLLALPCVAQERERAQLMQMQQQLQKLRQDNAQLSAAVQQSKTQAAEADKLKGEAASARRELVGGRQAARRLAAELEASRAELARSQAELEQLKAELARRGEALAQASAALARERGSAQAEREVLGSRLKLASTRAEACEAQHARASAVGHDVVSAFEQTHTRVCEPFTGLWRVREEQRVQAWRDRLFDARLDAK